MVRVTIGKINSPEDLDGVLLQLGKHKSFLAKKEASMNARLQKIKEEFDEETKEVRSDISILESDLEAFCIKNKNDFLQKRSRESIHGKIGFRSNPPKVVLLNRKYKTDTVIELLKKVFDKLPYVRKKEEINKEAILADYAQKKLEDQQLSSVGLRIDQDEQFYYEINWESLE